MSDTKAKASTAEWVELTPADTLDTWRAPTGDWQIVADVTLKEGQPRAFTNKPGTGAIVNGTKGRTSNLLSKHEHGDCEAHVEFVVPQGSNSGVYFMGRYEIQVLDSWDAAAGKPKEKVEHGDCGGIYQRWDRGRGYEGRPPRVNACRAPGEWQSFDVVFRAPRFDAAGKKIANARFVKVVHNGVVVHENEDLTGPTRAAMFNDEKTLGPVMLQGDHGPVAYRNVRIRSLPAVDAKKLVPDATLAAITAYEWGATRKSMAALEDTIRSVSPDALAAIEERLLTVLKAPSATVAGKQYVCRLLRRIGSGQSVPVLASLLGDKKLAHMARFALQHLPDPKVDEVFQTALGTLEGPLKVGIVTSIGERGNPAAVADLATLVGPQDNDLTVAAIRALGRIGGAEAAAALGEASVPRSQRGLQGESLLLCAESLATAGKIPEARKLYQMLKSRLFLPPTRKAAQRGLDVLKKK